MKKSLTIILAILVLAILLILLRFTSASNKAASTDEIEASTLASPASTDATESIELLNLDQADIASIDIAADHSTLTFTPNGEDWAIKGYEDYSLDQASINYRVKQITRVTTSRSIENADLKEYGLDKPSKVVTYHMKDGSTKVLSLGNLSLDETNIYIMIDSQPTTVYFVTAILNNSIKGNIDDYRVTELDNYESASIYNLNISGSEFPNISLNYSEAQNGYFTVYNLSTDEFTNATAHFEGVEALTKAFPSFKAENFVADHVTDLSPYGLDQPILHLTASYYDPNATSSSSTPEVIGQVDYIWGNTLDNGEIAFMKTGDSTVYSMDASFLDGLKEASKPFKLVDKYIAIPNISDVSSIEVDFQNTKYQMTVDDANKKYTLNEKEVDMDSFKALYRKLIAITADITLDEASSDIAPQITITYTLTDGTKQQAVFTNSNSNQYYQSSIYGTMLVGVTKTQLNNVKTALDTVTAGEKLEDK